MFRQRAFHAPRGAIRSRTHNALVATLASAVLLGVAAGARAAELIAHYDFNEAGPTLRNDSAGTNTLADETAGGGFIYDAAPVPGGTHGSLTVTPNQLGAAGGLGAGSGFWITGTSNEFGTLSNDFTVMSWLKVDAVATRQRIIGGYAAVQLGWSFGIDPGGTLLFTGYGVLDTGTSGSYVVPGTWVHVAASKSSTSGVTFFVNGEAVENIAGLTGDWTTSSQRWALLGNADNERLSGLVDDIRVYRGALDAEGIREALATPVAPIASYSFGETHGPQRVDPAGTATNAEEDSAANKIYGGAQIPAGSYGALSIGGTTFGATGGVSQAAFGAGYWLTAPYNEIGALDNDFTAMAWANPALPLSRQRIVGRAASGNDGWSFGLDALGKLVLTGYGMADVVSTVPGWQVGTWQHVAVSKSSTGGVTFYVNGNVLESFPLRTEDWNASTAPWKLLGGAGGEEFVGSVDEVKVFPGVLDLQSIREAATNRICSAPDSVVTTPGAVMSDIVIDDLDLVSDLDVKLDLSYPAVGQLSISLTHVGTGHGVFLTHTGESDCSARDIAGTFDDEAAQPASSQCAANPPAITGTFTPSQPLSTFDGDQLRGTWRLSVGAGVAGTGRLNRWCLQAQKSPVQNAIFANGFEYPNIGDVIGVSSVALPRAACNDSQGRTCESLIGNTTADAMREAAGAEFAIINSGALRANLTCPTTDNPNDYCPAYAPPPYPISRGQVVTVLPFGNVAMTVLVTGEELKAMLENGVSQMPVPAGRFPQVSGLCFSYDPAVSAGSRILGAVRQAPNGSCTGTAINFSAGVAYVLVENDFMSGGGDGYPNFTGRTTQGARLDGIVIDYVSLHTPITPSIQGRITCSSSGAAACPVQ